MSQVQSAMFARFVFRSSCCTVSSDNYYSANTLKHPSFEDIFGKDKSYGREAISRGAANAGDRKAECEEGRRFSFLFLVFSPVSGF